MQKNISFNFRGFLFSSHIFAVVLFLLLPVKVYSKSKFENCKPSSILTKLFNGRVEKKVGQADEWKLPKELNDDLQKYWNESTATLDEKMRHTYETVLEARINQLGRGSRVLSKLAARNILDRSGWYQKSLGKILGSFAGTHYNPFTNSIYMGSKGGKLSDYVVAFHEMQHAVDRNSKLSAVLGQAALLKEVTMLVPTPVGALTRYSLESKAIGAQWELMQQIPELHRQSLREAIVHEAKVLELMKASDEKWVSDWIKKRQARVAYSAEEIKEIESLKEALKNGNETMDILDKITVKSIDYAHLPKDEFVSKMRDLHGYGMESILKSHYEFSSIRKALIIGAGFSAYRIADGMYRGDSEQLKNGIDGMTYRDIRFYLHMIAAAASEPDSKSKDKEKDSRILKDLENDLDQDQKIKDSLK